MKRTIKLRESELKQMIAESVENILMEDEIEEVTVDPRWWRKDGELPDMKGGTYRKPKQIKVSEALLRQIVKESVEHVLSEGLFGNDARYGEKWYNPFSWVSDKKKAEIDKAEKARHKQLRDIANRRRAEEKEDAENYMKWRKSEAEKAQRKYAQSYGNGGAYHAGEQYLGIGHSAYDDMGR